MLTAVWILPGSTTQYGGRIRQCLRLLYIRDYKTSPFIGSELYCMSLGVSLCSGKRNIRCSDVSEKHYAPVFRDETDAMIMTSIFVLQTLVIDDKELNGVAFLKALT